MLFEYTYIYVCWTARENGDLFASVYVFTVKPGRSVRPNVGELFFSIFTSATREFLIYFKRAEAFCGQIPMKGLHLAVPFVLLFLSVKYASKRSIHILRFLSFNYPLRQPPPSSDIRIISFSGVLFNVLAYATRYNSRVPFNSPRTDRGKNHFPRFSRNCYDLRSHRPAFTVVQRKRWNLVVFPE